MKDLIYLIRETLNRLVKLHFYGGITSLLKVDTVIKDYYGLGIICVEISPSPFKSCDLVCSESPLRL